MKKLAITCDTKLRVPYQELHGIQGALKMLTKENFAKLRTHMVGDGDRKKGDGFNFALHVWKEKVRVKGKSAVKWWIVDGHGRHAVVKHLAEVEKYQVDPLPCVEIEAKSFKEAKRKVLNASSAFHTMTKQGLYEFMSDAGLTIDQMEEFELPEIDMPEFKMEFFDDSEPEVEPERKKVEFDAYQNAAIKQVVLYFAKDQYERVLAALDVLMKDYALEDYSQVIWRLLSEKNRT
jgi:hypothetical protein